MTWLRKKNIHWKAWLSSTTRGDQILWGGMVTLTLLPVINLFYILATTGANNLSNDYAFFIPLIDDILSGGYDWGHFFQDTFFVSHFQPLPILVYLVNAWLSGWNIYYELIFIVFLTVIRVVLTYQVLTILYPSRLRALLLPVISMLVFGASQISSFEFGASAVPLGLTAFGFTLAVWGLVKHNGGWKGFIYIIMGGLIASWTAATGVIAWPIYLVLMILLGQNKIKHLIAWLACAMVINFPYLYFLVINRKPGINAYLQSFINPRLIANLLGRPFANGIGGTTEYIPTGEAAGWIGLGLGVIGIGLVFARWKTLNLRTAPAMIFIIFGLLSAWQTSLYRVMIAPWYTNMVMPYWIGLVGMAYALGGSSEQPDTARSPNRASGKVIRKAYIILVMVITGVFYLNSNLTYQDKSFYLASRRPASAACLREYIFAPTYCERYVFQWSINRVPLDAFAWPLQNHSLSVFARQQTWSMQGDVILGRVFSPETPASSGARWVEGSTGTPADYSDYQHLNLMVTPAYSSAWNVELPENLRSAALLSASGFLDEDYRDAVDGSITFAVYITSPDLGEQLIYSRAADVPDRGWDSFNLSLTEYQGKEITIRFTIEGESEMLAALYRYPMIRLELADLEGSEGRPETQPVNTELSTQAVQAQRDDHVFILTEAQISNMTPYTREPFTWLVQGDPYLYFILLEPLSLKEYAWVSFRVQAPADMPSLAAEIFLFVEGQERPYYVVIPLLLDGKMHTYSYPLRLLDATGDLTALRLDPVMILPASGKSMVTVNDVRLISQP